MSSRKSSAPLAAEEALRVIDVLSQEAKKAQNETAKKILLIASCEIADLAMAPHELSKAA